jgi:hypothetical protein
LLGADEMSDGTGGAEDMTARIGCQENSWC